jgi:hypothetical protein
VAVDRDEKTVGCAPSPNDVTTVLAPIRNDIAVLHMAIISEIGAPSEADAAPVGIVAAVRRARHRAEGEMMPLRIGTAGARAVVAVVVLVGGCSSNPGNQPRQQAAVAGTDYRNAEYTIDGQRITLVDGAAEDEASPGSASRIVTRDFGPELRTDLNDDGREDVVFVLTQQRGGSATFYYAVAALNTEAGYLGSDGYLLGDRIAPQSTVVSRNPRHKNVIVVNYGDRRPGEPMTAEPSVAKTVYLKLDADTVRWGVVAADFEGESR